MTHMRGAGWKGEITRVDIERFASRSTAIEAERLAIVTERPAWNVQHSNINKPRRAHRATVAKTNGVVALEDRIIDSVRAMDNCVQLVSLMADFAESCSVDLDWNGTGHTKIEISTAEAAIEKMLNHWPGMSIRFDEADAINPICGISHTEPDGGKVCAWATLASHDELRQFVIDAGKKHGRLVTDQVMPSVIAYENLLLRYA